MDWGADLHRRVREIAEDGPDGRCQEEDKQYRHQEEEVVSAKGISEVLSQEVPWHTHLRIREYSDELLDLNPCW